MSEKAEINKTLLGFRSKRINNSQIRRSSIENAYRCENAEFPFQVILVLH